MSQSQIERVRCIHINQQGYVLEVQLSSDKSPINLMKTAAEFSDFRMKLASEAKSNPQIAFPELKGVKWFAPNKEEKKKKAVDDFFQRVLQLPGGQESLSTFLQPSVPDDGDHSSPKQSHDIGTRHYAVGEVYEELDSVLSKSPHAAEEPSEDHYDCIAISTLETVDTVVCPKKSECLYAPVIKMPSIDAKKALKYSASSKRDNCQTYAEIPLEPKRSNSASLSSSPVLEEFPAELPLSPAVPAKTEELNALLSLNSATSSGIFGESFTDDLVSTVSSHDKIASVSSQPRTSIKTFNSIPPMPSFAPPPMIATAGLPNPVVPVANPSVNIVALADYISSSDDVLSFKRGTLALLVLPTNNQWWCINLADAYGWVPAEFWRKIDPNSDTASLSTRSGAPWFVGKLTRAECEDLLMEHGKQQHFVVRESTNLIGHYALSVKYNDRVHHFPIELTKDNKYYIGKHHFKTVQSIISYYKKNALFYDENDVGVSLGSPLVVVKH